MSGIARKTVQHAGIYAIGNILRNIVSIVMLPIYTRYLTPADYGVLELLSMMLDFTSIVLGMRLGEAIFRYYCSASGEDEKNSVISASLFLAIVFNGIGVLVIILASSPIAGFLFDDTKYTQYISLIAFSLLFQVLIEVVMTYFRAKQAPWLFLFFSIFKLILQLSLNIYFVVFKGLHVEGVIYGALISGGVTALVLLVYTIRSAGITTSWKMIKSLTGYSIPLMLAGAGSFYIGFGDRYFLRVFIDLAEVGVYSLGYKFGFILMFLAWNPFQSIWDSLRYEVYKKENAQEIFQMTFVIISIILIVFALGMSLFVKDLLVIMAAPAFHSAHWVAPIVLLAYIIQGWTNYCRFGILLKGNTMQIAYASAITVIVITIAYVTLIPAFGAMGAAWATVIGFAVRLIWTDIKARKGYNMKLPWLKVLALLLVAIACYLVSFWIPDQLLVSIFLRSLLMIIFLVLLVTLPILSKHERGILIKVVKSPREIKLLLSR